MNANEINFAEIFNEPAKVEAMWKEMELILAKMRNPRITMLAYRLLNHNFNSLRSEAEKYRK